MKINETKVNSVPNPNLDPIGERKAVRNSEMEDLKPPSQESVQISDAAMLLKKASELAKSSAVENVEKLNDLKEKIRSGKYNIDNSILAEKIIQEHLNTNFGKNSL